VRQAENDVKFAVWDTAGQEFYHSLAPMYYRNARAAVVVFDLTSTASFQGSEAWVQELQNTVKNIFIILCGNKSDLPGRRVTPDQVLGLAQQLELPYVETSAKTGAGLDDLFQVLAKAVLDAWRDEVQTTIDDVHQPEMPNKREGCC
jgi:small GTP-binding protein